MQYLFQIQVGIHWCVTARERLRPTVKHNCAHRQTHRRNTLKAHFTLPLKIGVSCRQTGRQTDTERQAARAPNSDATFYLKTGFLFSIIMTQLPNWWFIRDGLKKTPRKHDLMHASILKLRCWNAFSKIFCAWGEQTAFELLLNIQHKALCFCSNAHYPATTDEITAGFSLCAHACSGLVS